MGQWSDLADQEAQKITGGGPWEFAKDLGRNARGVGEAALTIGSSIAADVPAGWAGMIASGDDRISSADAVEKTQNALTYQPRSAEGQRALQGIGNAMQTIMEPFTRGADAATEAGQRAGLPPWATAIPLTAITAGMELIPGKRGASGAARAGTRINLVNKRPGRYAAAAEESASKIDADFASVALRDDPTAGGRAAVLSDNPDASMANVAQDVPGESSYWNSAIPENGVEQTLGRRGGDVPANDSGLHKDVWSEVNEYGPNMNVEVQMGLGNLERKYYYPQGTDPKDALRQSQEAFKQLYEGTPNPRITGVNSPAGPGGRQSGSVQDTGGGKQVLKTQAGRNLATNAAEIAAGQPAPQDLPPVNVETPGAKVSTMERRVGTTGQYRGAPRGTASPQKLGRLRTNLKASLLRGVPGRSWYDRSSKAAKDLTAGREGLRDRYVGNIAVTSADTAVSGNAGFAIKGYNQLQAGDPVKTGRYPERMSKNINAINESRQGGEAVMLTDKVGPFYEANKVTDLGEDIRPTNDLWMARAFGYTQKDPKTGKFVEWSSGLGEAQHRFMDEEINRLVDVANKEKLGGFDDWTPERVQAAIWVDTKAAREGTTIERAAADFATDLDSRSVNITSEAPPANALNHQPGVYGDEARAKTAFDAQNEVLTDDQGRNILSTGANALTRPQITGSGVYQGQSNPVAVNRILAGTETGSPMMDASSRKLAETVASTEGMLRGQESVGYNFLRKPQRVGDANAAVVPQVEDLKGLQSQLDEAFGGDVIATPSEEGIRVLKVDGKPFDAKQRKALQGIVGEKPTWKINSGDLVGDFGDYKPSSYLKTIDDTVAGNMDTNTRWAAGALEKVDDALAKEFPDAGSRNKILQMTRQAISEGGIAKVRELVKQGVLPAVVIGILAGEEQADPASDQRPRA